MHIRARAHCVALVLVAKLSHCARFNQRASHGPGVGFWRVNGGDQWTTIRPNSDWGQLPNHT